MASMFTKKPDPNEIASGMEKELASAEMQKQTEPFDKFESAVSALNKAAEIFDDLGLVKEAEYTTTLLEVVAGKKKPKSKGKSKSKAHKSTRKTDSAMKGLTSEKMVENLKYKGWVFNADDNDAHGHSKGCMCSQCIGDVNDIRHGDDCVCMLCMDDSGADRYKMEVDDNAARSILSHRAHQAKRAGFKAIKQDDGSYALVDKNGKRITGGFIDAEDAFEYAGEIYDDDHSAHYDTKSDASYHVDRDSVDDWNLADLFDMHDFEDELDLPHSRRRI